ncbi:hypothetical protein LGK95_18145 [Clostridium algoriphilum]|uniref:DUF5661 family protein n=1 Tax=Clostridium algoriphilum TaxID=198347 RepID=UPI001CF571F1|nr:DUF5661 family protein [Clostridium algoriphilum]MCB2295407.1 hypothetical protein [Clostridium algoriphilum]
MYKYGNPYMAPRINYSNYGMDFTQESFNNSLDLIQEAVQDERADELLYDYLISVASTQEEKNIITSIRDEERNHRKWFREMYKYYTGVEIQSNNGENFIRPASYIEGISKSVFGELSAMEKYRFIREGLPSRLYRDTVFRILTDEMKHATKYNYILNKNSNSVATNLDTAKTNFSKEEAAAIALLLGIDFANSKFDLNEYWMGVTTELEHGRKYNQTNVTADEPITTGKIALAHLSEFPDYYTRLKLLEEEAKAYWSTSRGFCRQTKVFTLNELAQYDGTMGKPAYVSVNGIVYDVSDNSKWSGAIHYDLTAGKDLSSQFESCHGVASKLAKLPKIGVLKG